MEWVLGIIAISVAVWLVLVLALALAGRRALAREIATLLPNLTRLFAGLLRDPRVPFRAKVVLGATALYLAMPDRSRARLHPDRGSLDDAIVAAFALRYVLGTTSPEIVAEHWAGDPATLRRILLASTHPARLDRWMYAARC